MKARILTALIGVPLMLFVLCLAPIWVSGILAAFLSVGAAYELLHNTGIVKEKRLIIYSCATASVIPLIFSFGFSERLVFLLILLNFILMFAEIMLSYGSIPFSRVCVCMFCEFLLPCFFSGMVRILYMSSGRILILLPLLLSFVPDAGAYFVGRALGSHHFAPHISPNKTVEGIAGAVVFSCATMAIYTFCVSAVADCSANYIAIPIYGIFGALTATFGDLCFSCIKRQSGLKDYGKLLPGHGGILDRFDSMVLVLPVCELLLRHFPITL